MHSNQKIPLRQSGFSLVELIVGLVIGLLTTLVIMQVFSAFEGQKRSTSGSADAQTNGSIALMNIQRDIQVAGYGLPLPMANKESGSLRCAVFADYDPDNVPATDNSTNLFPVSIQDGAGDASDTITVRYSTNATGAIPVTIISAADAIAPAVGMHVVNNLGCKDDDIVLITNGNVCKMATIDTVTTSGTPPTQVDRIVLQSWTTLGAGHPIVNTAQIACMGNWQNYTYTLSADNELLRNGQPIVSEVVSLQAQYGISASAGSNQVNQWVDAKGGTWADPSVVNRNRIKAVRVAVVVRNGLLEKTNVTDSCTTAKGVVNTGPCAWDDADYSAAPRIKLSGDADWRKYRYRVFETIAPLRNMLWSREAVE